MGSLRRVSRLSDAEIIERYQAGEGRTMIALRAKVPDYHVEAVLTAARVRIRGPAEATRLALSRRQHKPWTRAKR